MLRNPENEKNSIKKKNSLKWSKVDLFLLRFIVCVFVLTQWFVKRIIIYIELLQDYYLQMCSENTPLRLTNGVLGNVIKLRDDEPSGYYCLDGIFI